MKKLILFTVLLLMAGVSVFGQVFIGPKAGVALSYQKLSGKYGDDFNSVLALGFLAGAVMEIPFSSRFGMQVEGYYVQKGSTDKPHSNGSFAGGDPFHIRMPYLSIPLIFKYRFQGRPLGGFISAGSESPFAFNGKSWEGDDSGAKETIEVGSGSNDYYKGSDWGLLIGGGLSYEIAVGELVLDTRYILGTSNIRGKSIDSSVLPSIKNRSLQISLGVIFPIGG